MKGPGTWCRVFVGLHHTEKVNRKWTGISCHDSDQLWVSLGQVGSEVTSRGNFNRCELESFGWEYRKKAIFDGPK